LVDIALEGHLLGVDGFAIRIGGLVVVFSLLLLVEQCLQCFDVVGLQETLLTVLLLFE
jgi:hypothetical protein